jgi:hypothetical protein
MLSGSLTASFHLAVALTLAATHWMQERRRRAAFVDEVELQFLSLQLERERSLCTKRSEDNLGVERQVANPNPNPNPNP